MAAVLTNRRRPWVLAFAGAGALALMGWWVGQTRAGAIGDVGVFAHPRGEELVLSLLTVLSVDGPDRYELGHAALRIPVHGPTAGLTVGEEVTVGAIVEDGYVEQRWRESAPARPWKRVLGLLGLGGTAALGAATLRVSREGIALRG